MSRRTLVLAPSLGTSVATLWGACAEALSADFDLVSWDLPGHGGAAPPTGPLTIAGLAADVLSSVDGPFYFAGDSVGGAIGLQLALDRPDRLLGAVLLCTGAQIGTPESWRERMDVVRASGTPAMVAGSAQRWFGPGFLEREPARGSALLHALSDTDDSGYVAVCGALADFDVRARLGEIGVPVLAVAGAHDVATPPDKLREIAAGVQDGRFVELADVAHLAPAEDPGTVADLIREHCSERTR